MTGAELARRGDLSPLLRMLRLSRPLRRKILVAALAGALTTGCGVALLAVSGFLLARASQHPSIAALSVAVVAVRGLSIGRAVFRYGERLASHDVALRALARIRVAIWQRLEVIAPAGLPGLHSGDLLARLVGDVDSTQDLFIRGITPITAAAAAGSGAVLACIALVGQAGLILAAGLLAGGTIVPALCVTAERRAVRQSAQAKGALSSAIADLLAGAAELTAFGAEDLALARAGGRSRELRKLSRRNAAASSLSSALTSVATGLTVWGVLLLGVDAVGAGTIGRVPLAAGTLTALAAFEAVGVLPAAGLALSRAHSAAGRITAILDSPEPSTEPADPLPVPTGPATISLRDVQVRYSEGGPLAVNGINLELAPGRKIALVGPNGAGKSTVAAVLLRFRELSAGTATLHCDGPDSVRRDLRDFRSDDLRALISGCPEDQYLFNASIAENLRIACPPADDAALAEVIERVGLTSWVRELPDGLSTCVGADGAAVSGGQRQRLVLARALLADPAILILDEPTAHLDESARAAFFRDLAVATAGRSVLLITHDLVGLDGFDEIIELDRGRVVEQVTAARVSSVA